MYLYNNRTIVDFPDPFPPTIASFFPAGISKQTFLKIGWPRTYLKPTPSKDRVAISGETTSGRRQATRQPERFGIYEQDRDRQMDGKTQTD